MNKENLFTLSEKGASGEYTASIVRVRNLRPIEGSDFLVLAEAAGEDVVVRKDEVHEGDIMVYCRIETVLDPSFLSANNLFDVSNYFRNSNSAEYERVLEESGKDEARKLCGYFNKHGRVRIARLRGCPSKGFLFGKDALVKWNPEFSEINLEDYLDIPFWDTIDGSEFIKVYIPFVPGRRGHGGRGSGEREKRFDRIIPEYFSFHYDTGQLTTLIRDLRPTDVVDISVKLHGTSTINGRILTKAPIKLNPVERMLNKAWEKKARSLKIPKYGKNRDKILEKKSNYLGRQKPNKTIKYDDIYSSRKVIQNQYISGGINPALGYYSSDVWNLYYNLLKGKLEKGTTIYGEIVGYVENDHKMIQKGYDYGCDTGKSKLMIYRVVHQEEGEKKVELDVPEVLEFTKKLIKKYPELKDRIHPIDLLYHGTLQDLYPDLDPKDEDWAYNVLGRLKHEERFGMEEREPLCKNNVPREGIVVRVSGDPRFCAKLKCAEFLGVEAKNVDKGEVDIEMAQASEG